MAADKRKGNMNEIRRTQILITLAALIVAIIHVAYPNITIDATTVFLLAVAVLPWLIPLVKSLEFPGGWKVEFQELEEAKSKAEKAGLLSNKKKGTKTPSYSFESILERDPNLALAGLRIELEKRLVQIAKLNKIDATRASIGQLLRLLNQERILTPEESSALADMSGLLNAAVHGANVDKRATDWAMEVGPKVLQSLDEKIEKYNLPVSLKGIK
jgi:hypothetical protein